MLSSIKPETALTLIPLLPLAGFLLNGLFGKRLSPTASGGLATIAIFCSFLLTLVCAGKIFAGDTVGTGWGWDWITSDWLSVGFRMQIDQLALVLTLVITGVGTLIHLYSVGYMSHDKAYWRYFSYLNLFCFAMLCLVLGDNMLVLFLGWEGVGLCSYLLIGFWYEDPEKAKAGKKAFIANRVGDLGFLIGMFLLMWQFGSLTYSEMAVAADAAKQAGSLDTGMLTLAGFFLFVGACGKSAQIPLYVWLPDAMAGPTPVSALIHAATMVTAGVYMICRLNFLFVDMTWVMPLIAVVGGLTALFAATIGLVQRDIKKVLAYSTVSQLGFMFVAVGCGEYAIAVFHLVTHAFFKAQLFLGSGSVIHAMEAGHGHGNPDAQDMRLMGGLRKKMPVTSWTMMLGGLALAGIPGFSGFFSKDEILLMAFTKQGNFAYTIAYGMCVLAAACTAFYTARLLALTFFGTFRGEKKVWDKLHESPWTMCLPLILLAILAVVGGYISLPHNLAHFTWFLDFLNGKGATFEPSYVAWSERGITGGQMWTNMIVSSLIAVGFFAFGFSYYKKDGALEKAHQKATGSLRPVFGLLLNKYWVDEIYETLIIKPIKMMAQIGAIFVDALLIDLVCVNGPAYATGMIAQTFRRLQTGLVSHYLFIFSGGALVVIIWLIAA